MDIRLCRLCLDPFTPTDHRERYCSDAHRRKANEARETARLERALGKARLTEWRMLLDEHNWQCFYCGKKLDAWTAVPDHKKPRSRGGSDAITNIAPACGRCNRRKGTMTVQEYRRYLANLAP